MRELEVASLSDFQAYVAGLDSGGIWIFRGQKDSSWDLVPGFYRGLAELDPPYEPEDAEWVAQLERNTYRSFDQYSRAHKTTPSAWERVCLAQHYGAPTRLLDWTRLPLAAAYFAVLESQTTEAAVWALDISVIPFPGFLGRVTRQYAHRVAVLEGISSKRRPSFFQEISVPFDPDPGAARSKPLIPDDLQAMEEGFLCVLDPPRFDDRLDAQAGLFTCYYSFDDYDLVWNHSDYLLNLEAKTTHTILHKIRIAAGAIKDFSCSLERVAGLSLYKLFPDLVGLGRQLAIERQRDFAFYADKRA